MSNLRCSTRGDLGLRSPSLYGLEIVSEWQESIGDCVEIKGSNVTTTRSLHYVGHYAGKKSTPQSSLYLLNELQSSVGLDPW